MVLYQSTTETPHILPLLPTVATYQMLIHQTDEPGVQCSDAKIHSKFHRKMYLYEARCVSRSSPLSSCNNFFLNCHSQLMMVMTVMIHIVYPASASNSIVFMHHMKPEVLQLFMSCNFNHQPYAVWDTNPDENLKSLTQPMMLYWLSNVWMSNVLPQQISLNSEMDLKVGII